MWRIYLKTLALPPAVNLLVIVLALLVSRRFPRFALLMLLSSVAALYVLSTPFVAGQLRMQVETVPALRLGELQPPPAHAIVVLGAGREMSAPEYGGADTASSTGLQRLRYGARLARITGLPILVSGGSGYDGIPGSEADVMAMVLEQEFGQNVRWREGTSNNTLENAQRSGDILLGAGVKQILLVTSAWHMPRASALFRARGFEVVPAPTGFFSPAYRDSAYQWLPTASALQTSSAVLHELLGMAWYRLSGRI